MGIFSVVLVMAFSIVLCIVEIPKMYKEKLYRELAAFSVLLCCGVILAVLKCLNIDIPNPLDFIAIIYSPITSLMKDVFE